MLLGHCNAAVGYNYTSYGMAGTRYMDTQLKADIERFRTITCEWVKGRLAYQR